ncbi:hypothetical protein E2C01_003816 [Portunus trituberculatus]|uniref:Uncharacterized protein n=1 Tax=Portunus trituberculatus TaxID=210409 RepID=A0A5B7CPQ1_PORTR|nr:hypothetical protein [Portunus trituberculatus]
MHFSTEEVKFLGSQPRASQCSSRQKQRTLKFRGKYRAATSGSSSSKLRSSSTSLDKWRIRMRSCHACWCFWGRGGQLSPGPLPLVLISLRRTINEISLLPLNLILGGLRSVSLNGWKSGPMDLDRAFFHSCTASSRDFSCNSGIDADCAMFLVRGDELGTD